MNKQQIIAHIAEQGLVESLIKKMIRDTSPSIKDLSQDLYCSLLEKDDDYIVNMYYNGELNNFIIGMIRKNYFSKTSPYYKQYRKFNFLTQPLTNIDNEEKFQSID